VQDSSLEQGDRLINLINSIAPHDNLDEDLDGDDFYIEQDSVIN